MNIINLNNVIERRDPLATPSWICYLFYVYDNADILLEQITQPVSFKASCGIFR